MNTQKTYRYILSVIMLTFSLFAKAQDAQFSQYYSSPLNLAPSFAGTGDGIKMFFNHRTQWPMIKSLSTAYNTSSLGFDYFFPNFRSWVGILANATSAGNGLLIKSKFAGIYSFNVRVIDKWYFRPGIELSYNRIDYDFYKFTFGDAIANGRGITEEDPGMFNSGVGNFDIGTSALIYSPLYWTGVTVAHILEPNESVIVTNSNENTQVSMKLLVFGGAKVSINNRMDRDDEESMFVSFLYRNQFEFDQFDIGAYWLKMPIMIGVWYRGLPGIKKNFDNTFNHDAVTLLAGYKRNRLSVSISYDVTISSLYLNSGGAYEIALGLLLIEQKTLTPRPKRVLVPCPRF